MVSLLIFCMTRGVGQLSLELDIGGFSSSLFRWIGKWGILVIGRGVFGFGILAGGELFSFGKLIFWLSFLGS
jgi:hypothetical protein